MVQVCLGKKVGKDGLLKFTVFKILIACKNWRKNLLFSTRKPCLRRKNPTVNFDALANVRLSIFSIYFEATTTFFAI